MNKHAASTTKSKARYHYKFSDHRVKSSYLVVLFVLSIVISFLVAHVTYRLYRRSVDAKLETEQRIQEQQSMEALLERY